ncbi:nucleolar protein 9 [Rattus norvegicus]|uniref:Polynucleotide 5'-hydroxyl-kinase NOL9 n=1 Tax=Rattus norvegicus TaxID=10116 RepID=A6IUG5_RAT|nr:polynucleotide 5'-hydroxyl-kinase NOL9 [Rattus norvegicus]EDL81216.1 nucleolar protein 9 [Rattus norvegicus]|eukprot:XP_233702.4 PREDICTED: polynucleotide 5'-hydroxyl-kinase NOL9 [Rattus norvegicus]
MAESEVMLRRVPSRSSWQRVRKARPHLLLSRRGRRRFGVLTRGELRRLRRRLLRAHALGGDWKLGVPAGAHVAVKCKIRTRSRPGSRSQPTPSVPPVPCTRVGSCSLLNPRNHSTPQSRAGRRVLKVSPNITQPTLDLGSGRVLLMLPPGEGFTFSGICRVTCIYGQLEIYGHIIKQGQPPQDVFSVYTHSYLTINGVPYSEPEKSKKGIRREIRALLKPYMKLDDRNWVVRYFPPLGSILILERLQTRLVDFLRTYKCASYVLLQENILVRDNSEFVALNKIGIRRQKRKKGICLSESGLCALEELISVSCDGCPVILLCGACDIGKSTFSRILINHLLNSIPGVDYLECDLGQTEFTPPGCISLLNITEPLLGPPYTHQRKPQKMVYFGKTNCHNEYENYIEIVKYVFRDYKREFPLIINTMGWVSGDGLLLLVDLIRVLSPNYVVQLTSDRSEPMQPLTSEFVELTDGLYTKSKIKRYRGFEIPEFGDSLGFAEEEKESSPVPVFTGHILLTVYSEFLSSKNEKNRGKYNRIFRDLAVLGYLSQLMLPVTEPLCPLHSLTPYQVPFNAVAIRVTHADVAPTHILYAMNASWVGLCKIVDDMKGYTRGPILLAQNPICDCLGFGICRGIDMDKRLYHILTPLPPEELRTVNCLLVGTISIPHCIFKNQPGTEGTVPYVTRDYNLKLLGASEKIGEREYRNILPRHKSRQRRK